MNRKPNKLLAPIVIAGVTIGFLASAYKFVFSKPEQNQAEFVDQTDQSETDDESPHASTPENQ